MFGASWLPRLKWSYTNWPFPVPFWIVAIRYYLPLYNDDDNLARRTDKGHSLNSAGWLRVVIAWQRRNRSAIALLPLAWTRRWLVTVFNMLTLVLARASKQQRQRWRYPSIQLPYWNERTGIWSGILGRTHSVIMSTLLANFSNPLNSARYSFSHFSWFDVCLMSVRFYRVLLASRPLFNSLSFLLLHSADAVSSSAYFLKSFVRKVFVLSLDG